MILPFNPNPTKQLVRNTLSFYRRGELSPEGAFGLIASAARGSGDPEALYHYGTFLIEGIGCEENPEEGIKALVRSANGGDTQAMLDLGEYYLRGEVVEQNTALALEWFECAHSSGDERGSEWLLYVYSILSSQ